MARQIGTPPACVAGAECPSLLKLFEPKSIVAIVAGARQTRSGARSARDAGFFVDCKTWRLLACPAGRPGQHLRISPKKEHRVSRTRYLDLDDRTEDLRELMRQRNREAHE